MGLPKRCERSKIAQSGSPATGTREVRSRADIATGTRFEMTEIDFQRIRPLGGSKTYAFEEFCAHLARREEAVPEGSRFARLDGAGGDGGVECYWTLPDGSEWGWQSKLLFELDKAQIGGSVSTALRIHPKLTRYVVCLPFNLTGPTGRPGTDQRTRWAEWVEEWENEARGRDMNVEFVLWEARSWPSDSSPSIRAAGVCASGSMRSG